MTHFTFTSFICVIYMLISKRFIWVFINSNNNIRLFKFIELNYHVGDINMQKREFAMSIDPSILRTRNGNNV